MKTIPFWAIPAILLLFAGLATPQTGQHNFPTPPQPMDQQQQPMSKPSLTPKRIDFAQLQREADDLSRIAQTIPADVVSVRKGMLPKDTLGKLKQIEKLSKRLRAELSP